MDQKKYIVVSGPVLMEMMDCFASLDEFDHFIADLISCMEEMKFIESTGRRDSDNEKAPAIAAMRMMFLFAYFCRDNIELIQQLVPKIRFDMMDDEEKTAKMGELGRADREILERLIKKIAEEKRDGD